MKYFIKKNTLCDLQFKDAAGGTDFLTTKHLLFDCVNRESHSYVEFVEGDYSIIVNKKFVVKHDKTLIDTVKELSFATINGTHYTCYNYKGK
jgi:hypothetical protein